MLNKKLTRMLLCLSGAILLFAVSGCVDIIGYHDSKPYCELHEVRCLNNAPQRCTDDLTWKEPSAEDVCSGTTPVCSQGACVSVTQIDAGGQHTCAVLSDDTVACWGNNENGQLGDGTLQSRAEPVHVAGLTEVWKVVVAGSDVTGRSCVVMKDRSVKCWGALIGQNMPSDGSELNQLEPTAIPELHDVEHLALGSGHSCAVLRDGTVWCWGSNDFGQAGQQPRPFVHAPEQVHGLGSVRQISADPSTADPDAPSLIAAGGAHTCMVTGDKKTVQCWGSNGLGQCGLNTTEWGWGREVRPSQTVPDLDEVNFLDAGYGHTCAVGRYKGSRQTVCWGRRDCGHLGGLDNGACAMNHCGADAITIPPECKQNTPTVVYSDPDGAEYPSVRALALGAHHSCVLSSADGQARARCWGRNENMQSNPSVRSHVVPTEEGGIPYIDTGFVGLLTAGSHHTCVKSVAGDVICWGRGLRGQTGDSTMPIWRPAMAVQWSL
ncbi:RCC1 domain-containing protein [Sorangium sp. So ce117]|uniref:RCC1 domain-containing protein n=1 Tax=Sorangium sp. So ce117 TaxID=3133277 RepID=UPI003F600C3E